MGSQGSLGAPWLSPGSPWKPYIIHKKGQGTQMDPKSPFPPPAPKKNKSKKREGRYRAPQRRYQHAAKAMNGLDFLLASTIPTLAAPSRNVCQL